MCDSLHVQLYSQSVRAVTVTLCLIGRDKGLLTDAGFAAIVQL